MHKDKIIIDAVRWPGTMDTWPRCTSVDPRSGKQCRHPVTHHGSCAALRPDCDKTEYRWNRNSYECDCAHDPNPWRVSPDRIAKHAANMDMLVGLRHDINGDAGVKPNRWLMQIRIRRDEVTAQMIEVGYFDPNKESV